MMLNRRQWISLNSAALAMAAIGPIGTLISSCVGPAKYTNPETEKTYVYPELPQNKIQAPEHGCLIGFHSNDPRDSNWGGYSFLETRIGMGPKIMMPPYYEMENTYTQSYRGFPRELNVPEKLIMHDKAIPYLNRMLTTVLAFSPLSEIESDKAFVREIALYAKNISDIRRPMFFTTMVEMNGDWNAWSGDSKAVKKAWRFMHKVFEDQGANEYATWVWQPYMHIGSRSRTNPPEMYYPGDDYVDWLGLSVYKKSMYDNHNKRFGELASSTISGMHRNHPDKPFMISEMGADTDARQASWFTSAFNYIRRHPKIKAAVIWDNDNTYTGYKHKLTDASFEALKVVFKDPYFIGIR